MVLLRVEDFEQRRGGVPFDVTRQLVYLVKEQEGIGTFGAADRVDYTPGHCPDICAPVTSDFRFV